jgi:hypothetical protein
VREPLGRPWGWEQVFPVLAGDASNEYALLDSPTVRAQQHSAGAKRGDPASAALARSQGGLSPKRHATTEALGLAERLSPDTRGQAHDLDGVDTLRPGRAAGIVGVGPAYPAGQRALEPLPTAGKTAGISPKANRSKPRS